MLTRLSRLAPAWLTAVFGLLTLGPLLLLAYFAITRSSEAVEREATARVQSSAALSADFVRAELDGLAVVVDSYAKRPTLIEALADGDPARYDAERIAFHLGDLRETRPGVAISFLADPSGILIDIVPPTPSIVGDDFGFRDWYQGVTRTRRPYVSEAYVTAATGNDRVVAAAAFVFGGTPRRPLGVLVAGYSLDYIQSFAERIARRQGVLLTITDQAGVIVASPRAQSRRLVSIADDIRVQAALRGESGALRHTGEGGAEVAAYNPVAKYGWTVTASVPRDKAFASVRGLRNAVLSIAALLGLVLVGGIAALGLTLRTRAKLEARERSSRLAAENARSELEDQNIELEAQANELAAQARRLAESQAQLTSVNEVLATQHGELERAHAFSERLAHETDVVALAPCILEQIGDVAHADVGTLHAVDLEGCLQIVATRVAGADESAFALIDDGAVARVLADGQTLTADADGSMLYVPLVHASRPLGVVTLGRLTGGPFSTGEREKAEHFADQAAVALANAFALRDVRRLADVNRAVLDATTDAILMVDLDGRTLVANSAMGQMAGAADALTEAMSIWDAAAERAEQTTDPAAYRAAIERLAADPEREAVDVYQIAESGAWIQRYSAPVRNADGLVVGRIFVNRDVTAEREAQQLKSDLVATVSHELRTPLTGILGFAELLAMDDADEESKRSYVETIRRESIRLRDLINDFLDLQRIEEGSFRLQLEPVAFAELLREQASLFEAHSSLHSIQLQLEPGVDVLGERDRLAQVIANLLSNAIKYSPEGGVVVMRARAAGANVRVEVTDSGIGIPPDQQRRIFEKFFRVDSTSTRRIGGTGLGLALSRDIVEAHGGTIGFSSVDGRGTTFWFELPSIERDAIRFQPAVRPRVLVVEDNASMAELLNELLVEDGYDVDVALTGEEALARIAQSPPTVVCLDIGLTGRLDGWEVLTRLKASPETASIPVLVCTAGEREDRAAALAAADFVTKPFSRERLLEAVTRLVSSEDASILVVDDDVAVRRLVMTTIARGGLDLREAADGVEALERIAERRPDVIVLDLSMPVLDGFAVLERLHEEPETRSIPVIVLTAKHVTPAERARLCNKTVTLLKKSAYSAKELRRLVREAAAGKGDRALATAAPFLASPPASPRVLATAGEGRTATTT